MEGEEGIREVVICTERGERMEEGGEKSHKETKNVLLLLLL